ncbi:MAG: hypothetical protein K5669_09985 [Lachnospiraceae bacterium]|nr:hypothetical protein [Lachnospiraceae bacterium]
MSSSNWYKLDNVAKVFLATMNKRDTRTLRVSCTLKEEIDPALLQEAVLSAIQDRPQVQVRIRRGIFWHYLEDTDILPVVTEEHDRVCPLLYVHARAMLHYQVTYFGNRINLDICHAICDGTGALEFLNIIVLDYLRLRYPGDFADIAIHSGATADDLSQDSYRQFFENMDISLSGRQPKQVSYHPGVLKLPYNQLQFFEIHMPLDEIKKRAKEMGVSLTSYLGALWMIAIYDEIPPRKRKLPITISLPVNLRNYYPSHTARNFFNNINVSHLFKGDISVEELAKEFDESFKSKLDPESIKKQMDSFETMEFFAPVRAVPLIIKQPVVRYFSWKSDSKASMVFSNLGIMSPPGDMGKMIENYSGFCSANKLFSTMFSYNGDLTLGVSSPYANTGVIKNFVRGLSGSGVPIKVYATEVIR